MWRQLSNWCCTHKKLTAGIAVGLISLVMFLISIFSSFGAFGDPGDSAIVDEVAHIPAGYSYIKYQDYRLNPEHPPVAKALAGLALSFDKNLKGFNNGWTWGAIDQWDSGWDFLYHSGNDATKMLETARFPLILLMIGFGLFIYKWAAELWGRKVGLLVLLMFAFYPDILAHGRLVTTDVPAAFGFVIATYFFDKAITKKTWTSIIYAGLAFGLAQLLKFSAILLFLVFLILIVIRAIMDRDKRGGSLESGVWRNFWKNFKVYFWTCLTSLITVWLVYIPFVWKTPAGIEHQLIETNLTADPRTLILRNFLHHFENNPITRALGHYILGIFLVIGRVGGGNKTFILGHLSYKSISWFFPVAWLLKTPISVILLVLISLGFIIFRWPKDKKNRWLLSLILTPIIVYWAITLKGQLDIGIRHLMPTVPFVLLMIGYLLSVIFKAKNWTVWKIAALALILFQIISVLSNYPNFISYFNEFTPKSIRYTRLVDSSLDWGQDLLRLKKYVDDNKITSIKVDYFGGSIPSYYIPESSEWHSSYGPTTGWLAVSATFYQSSKLVGPDEGQWSYNWLDKIKPTAIIGGGSILVYHITSEELISNPPTSPYPITHPESPTGVVSTPKVGL